jgi:phosphomannomutase/phosphoglucomutase
LLEFEYKKNRDLIVIAKDKIFREYDIRGEYNVDFNCEFAYRLGLAYANYAKQQLSKDNITLAVGRDCRLSGPELEEQLVKGLQAGGANVVRSGMGATPQLYFTVFEKDLDGGIQVSASHNPAPDNGFKMLVGKGTLSGSSIQDLKAMVLSDDSLVAEAPGTVEEYDAQHYYLQDLIARSKDHTNLSKGLKVVVDGGNGVGGPLGPELLRQLGCEVIEMYTDPDGTFPNHHPDPTVLENIAELRERVIKEGADVGIAWDGDADRIGVVDNNGDVVWGDMLLVVYGRQILKEVSNPIIIGDVKCSEILFSTLKKEGADTVMWKTGHSLIKAKLKELNAHLAGEMSGHMFFVHRYYGYDDALHASARLVEILSNTDSTLSELLSDVPKAVSTPEIRLNCAEEVKFRVAEEAKGMFNEYETNTIDGVRINFPHGWGLVRASNTGPVLVMRFEADTQEHLSEYQGLVEGRIQELIAKLSS